MQFINIEANLGYNDYNLLTRSTLNDVCVYNKSPFERFHGILRVIYRVHHSIKINNKVKLPFKQLWNPWTLDKECKKRAENGEAVCFCFDGSAYRFVQSGLIEYLRKKYRGCYITFAFDGKVEIFRQEYKNFSMDYLKQTCDLVFTYNELDAKEYGLNMLRSNLIKFKVDDYVGKAEYSDAFFVGAAKDRLQKILEVFEILNDAGLICDFHITDVDEQEQRYQESISYNKRISYEEVLSRVAATKCVVNILEGGNGGITLRDHEAIGFKKLLITDNKKFRDTNLFVSENVVFTDELKESIEKIKDTTMPVCWDVKEEFSERQSFEWLESELKKSRRKQKI